MLIASFLALPLWQVIPGYFILGILWALAYLPRSITLQARAYKKWRDRKTGGLALREVLGVKGDKKKNRITPEAFLAWRGDQPFSERRILAGFIVNIAFWPLRVIEKVLFDILRSTFAGMLDVLADAWNKLIIPMFRLLGRLLRALGRGIRAVFRWIGHAIDAIWDNLIAPVLRTVRRWARALWYDVLVPLYTWTYRYITKVYKSIIQRANREAIADLAALDKATQKDLVK